MNKLMKLKNVCKRTEELIMENRINRWRLIFRKDIFRAARSEVAVV